MNKASFTVYLLGTFQEELRVVVYLLRNSRQTLVVLRARHSRSGL